MYGTVPYLYPVCTVCCTTVDTQGSCVACFRVAPERVGRCVLLVVCRVRFSKTQGTRDIRYCKCIILLPRCKNTAGPGGAKRPTAQTRDAHPAPWTKRSLSRADIELFSSSQAVKRAPRRRFSEDELHRRSIESIYIAYGYGCSVGTRYSTPAWLCLATEPDCPAARPALDSHSGCNKDTRR